MSKEREWRYKDANRRYWRIRATEGALHGRYKTWDYTVEVSEDEATWAHVLNGSVLNPELDPQVLFSIFEDARQSLEKNAASWLKHAKME